MDFSENMKGYLLEKKNKICTMISYKMEIKILNYFNPNNVAILLFS